MGRSYLHVPQDTDVDLRTDEPPHKCYAPKKFIHQWLVLLNSKLCARTCKEYKGGKYGTALGNLITLFMVQAGGM